MPASGTDAVEVVSPSDVASPVADVAVANADAPGDDRLSQTEPDPIADSVVDAGGDDLEDEVEPEGEAAFEDSRSVVHRIHNVLSQLKAGKENQLTPEAFSEAARDLQLQLLALRRAHRCMAKASDAGRSAEAQARKLADIEHARLETRRYESACSRMAARRCRNFPTPQLAKLRPHLEGVSKLEDAEEAEAMADTPKSSLSACLDAERVERARLAAELEALERRKAKDLEALREREQISNELLSRLQVVDKALEPICDMLELRPRPDMAPPADKEAREQLPVALRLIVEKFDNLAVFSNDAVTLRIEGATSPPAKRARLEEATGFTVVVDIATPSSTAKASLRFAYVGQPSSLVLVSNEGSLGDSLLERLWPEDDGRSPPLVEMLKSSSGPVGRPYFWAQVLAGLRECLITAAPALQGVSAISALDVVQHVRAKLVEKL